MAHPQRGNAESSGAGDAEGEATERQSAAIGHDGSGVDGNVGLLLGNGPTEMVGLWMVTGKAEEETKPSRVATLTPVFNRGCEYARRRQEYMYSSQLIRRPKRRARIPRRRARMSMRTDRLLPMGSTMKQGCGSKKQPASKNRVTNPMLI